jgi:hypothetical protein
MEILTQPFLGYFLTHAVSGLKPQRDNRILCSLRLLMYSLSDLAQKELRREGDEDAIAEAH